jgi:REP element-mobilizing transposase RayT
MARHAREISRTEIYHIMVRGINKEQIFKKDFYKTKLLETLKEIKTEIDFSIIAYCIMNNHLHLLAKISDIDLASVMKKINVTYAMFYNKLETRYGYVFQGRFKSEAVEDDKYLLGALRYIHNNPVKAGLSDNIANYNWSSAREYINKNLILVSEQYINEISSLFGETSEFIKFHNLYDDYLYLDTKEEQSTNIDLIVQHSIEQFVIDKGITNQFQITPAQKDELATILIKKNLINIKNISNLCNLPYSHVLTLSKTLGTDL